MLAYARNNPSGIAVCDDLGRVNGTFALESASTSVAESAVHAVVAAGSFHTGAARRDDQVRSPAFLDADRHPAIRFESSGAVRGDDGVWTMEGSLTVRGHRAPLRLTIDSLALRDGSLRLSLTATAHPTTHPTAGPTTNPTAHPALGTATRAVVPAEEEAEEEKDLLMSPKIAVIYYSSTGTVHELAESVAEGARKEGAEVRLLRVAELAPKEAITATATAHGGQQSTLLAPYNSVHHFGGIIVTPGYTDPVKFADGNPYGTSHLNGQGAIPVDDTALAAAVYQGKRVAAVTARFKNA
ncbi:hypothetical protein BOG92_015140 [Streptomyces sp. WAC00263]|nr:hypothetical protein BOG92_015140 [Streptomyces sp. WAC00263]